MSLNKIIGLEPDRCSTASGGSDLFIYCRHIKIVPIIHRASYPVSNGNSFHWRRSLENLKFIFQHHRPRCSFSSRGCEVRRPDRPLARDSQQSHCGNNFSN